MVKLVGNYFIEAASTFARLKLSFLYTRPMRKVARRVRVSGLFQPLTTVDFAYMDGCRAKVFNLFSAPSNGGFKFISIDVVRCPLSQPVH